MKGRRKTPQEKKELEYQESRPLVEVPHGFRKSWPKKKALVNRATRQKEELQLRSALANDSLDELSAEQLRTSSPKHQIDKWNVMTLRERVQRNLKHRESLEHRSPENHPNQSTRKPSSTQNRK